MVQIPVEPLIRALPLHLLAVLLGRADPEGPERESSTDAQSAPAPSGIHAAAQQLVLPSAYLGRIFKVLLGLSDIALQSGPLATRLWVRPPLHKP